MKPQPHQPQPCHLRWPLALLPEQITDFVTIGFAAASAGQQP